MVKIAVKFKSHGEVKQRGEIAPKLGEIIRFSKIVLVSASACTLKLGNAQLE